MSDLCAGKVEFHSAHNADRNIILSNGDALMIVDVQKDFLPGGTLAVPKGDEVIRPLNRYLAMFVQRNLPVFASGDYHPPNHCSFQAQGGPWPPHCVAGTPGAGFAANLSLPDSTNVIRKGGKPDYEAYSAFEGTDLAPRLRAVHAMRVFIGGLATDYCVLNTTRDAVKLGFEVFLLRDAIRAVDAHPDDGEKAEAEMRELGAKPVQLEDLTRARL